MQVSGLSWALSEDWWDAMTPDNSAQRMLKIRSMRIILFGLVLGAVAFAGIVFYTVQFGKGPAAPNDERMTPTLTGLALVALALYFVLPGYVLREGRRRLLIQPATADVENLLRLYGAQLVTALVLCEAATFGILLGYLMTGVPWPLFLAAIAVLLMLARFPTRDRASAW
jgi:hypothetical protein